MFEKKEGTIEILSGITNLIKVSKSRDGIQLNFDKEIYTLEEEFKLPLKTFLETILKKLG